ncbi:hypothetical protein GIB67_037992 [Kingdonia uniflora]|uniref:Uncharacterized protein n=1 Tax=Kingdonia uniflora TaxID=39325 RepID=A0A7J7LHN4_9MAGN|nr:hypothetical protein GIB67_037992 [Kingdonia uniflora]
MVAPITNIEGNNEVHKNTLLGVHIPPLHNTKYRQAYEVLKEESSLNGQNVNVRAHLYYSSRADRRCYNLPSTDEIAMLKKKVLEEDEETEGVVIGIVDGQDGVSPQTMRDNQGDDNECPELENEKVELELDRSRKDDARQCNQEFTENFDKKIEANEDRYDQYVKVHFKFVEATQTIVDLTRQIEEKDAEIEKGQKELEELKALERLEETLNRSVAGLKNDLIKKINIQEKIQTDLANSMSELERLKKRLVDKVNKLKRAQDNLSSSEVVVDQLSTVLLAKDMEFRMVQIKYNELNERVVQLKAE